MTHIKDLGETRDNLIKDTIDALLAALNIEFYQCFSLEKLSWQGGTKQFTYEELAHFSKIICKNVVSSGVWGTVHPNDSNIMDISTKANDLQHSKSQKNPNPQPPSKHGFRIIAG